MYGKNVGRVSLLALLSLNYNEAKIKKVLGTLTSSPLKVA
jgi:hypothetical protein